MRQTQQRVLRGLNRSQRASFRRGALGIPTSGGSGG